jgi:hypothetical protein
MGLIVFNLRYWCLVAASVQTCILTAGAQSTFPHWPRHTVQWGHQATLQDLLKAGVSVKHFDQYASLRKLTIKNAWISFQHPGQEPLPYFPIDQAEIDLYSNYELASIDVCSYPLTLVEIKTMAKLWLRATVGPAARMDKFDDRWAWIYRPQTGNGMFQIWENAGVGGRAAWRNQNLKAAALPYKRGPLPDNLPFEPWE